MGPVRTKVSGLDATIQTLLLLRLFTPQPLAMIDFSCPQSSVASHSSGCRQVASLPLSLYICVEPGKGFRALGWLLQPSWPFLFWLIKRPPQSLKLPKRSLATIDNSGDSGAGDFARVSSLGCYSTLPCGCQTSGLAPSLSLFVSLSLERGGV